MKTEVLNAKVSSYGYLWVLLNRHPDPLKYREVWIGSTRYWVGENEEGFVSVFRWTGPDNEGGFYGDTVEIELTDGTKQILLGPYHLYATDINRYYPRLVNDRVLKLSFNIVGKSPGLLYGDYIKVSSPIIREVVEKWGVKIIEYDNGRDLRVTWDRKEL